MAGLFRIWDFGLRIEKAFNRKDAEDAKKSKAFLLNPVPEPSSLLALGGGLMAFAGLLRKRRALSGN